MAKYKLTIEVEVDTKSVWPPFSTEQVGEQLFDMICGGDFNCGHPLYSAMLELKGIEKLPEEEDDNGKV